MYFFAYSYELSLVNNLCFTLLVMLWLRRFGIKTEVDWQTDRGEEFGGSNPGKIATLNEKHYQPLGACLTRIPRGKKGYNGRVERSHRVDDEELYIPFLPNIHNAQELLDKATGWEYFYNLVRPHYGKEMDGKTPFERLKDSDYNLPREFAMFPPIILDMISTECLLETGNNLLPPLRFSLHATESRCYCPRLERPGAANH